MVDADLEVRVLGPVEAVRDGARLRLGGRRQRALLSLLVLEVGRPVAADHLIHELWQGEAPPGASTLPSYVSRLRGALGSHDVIEPVMSGYRLNIARDQIDVKRFERLVEEGRAALVRGRTRRASDRLRAALALWRGRPFGDVGDDGELGREAARLEEVRLLALEDRIDADLALGAGPDLVDELEAFIDQHPYRERFWAQLMLALYRAHRQADALAAYHRARRTLDEELGLEPGPALQELELAILRQDVPVAPALEARHNLPAAVTTFVGREEQLLEIERLLEDTRLLTLTGVGGVGKTRIGLELAKRALPDLPDGVWFVDLSGVGDASLVAHAIALALGLGEQTAAEAPSALLDHLRDTNLLLVLDNCEHVREAVADLAERLLTTVPGLRILATSREALGVPGEVDYPVPPLALPPAGAGPAGAEVSEAVQLFLARARTARPHLPDDDRSLATAARICRDLDGLPLAIELAAARAKALSLEDIATRLSDRFRFLVSWRRLSPARHRTLREAMDWSYGLLTTEEQRLLARLSVFAGEFTLDAVATICLDGDQEQALSLTERLVGTSLVVPSERGGEMRYRLLDTIRTYAEEQFDAESAAQVRPAHARYFLRLAEGADLTAVRRGAGERLDLAIDAQDNLRRALGWAVETGSVSFGLELATSLERFWVTHDPREGKRWFAALFDRPEAAAAPAAVRANALRAYGGSADISDDDDSAERAYAASLAIFRELDDEGGQAALLHRLAITAQRRGDLARADELVRASHQIHERLGNRWGTAQTLGTQGAIARDAGDERRAVDLFETSLELAREARVIWWVGGTLAELANLALRAGDLDQAHRRARESLTIAERASDRAGRVFGVGLLARVAAERGEAQLAATLWAAVETEDARSPLGGWSRHRESYRERMAQILADARPLDDASRSTLDGAVSLALGRTHIGNARTAAARA